MNYVSRVQGEFDYGFEAAYDSYCLKNLTQLRFSHWDPN